MTTAPSTTVVNQRALKPISEREDGRIYVDKKWYWDFSSNDYLGLSQDPTLKETLINATKKMGTGSTGSRLLSGDYSIFHDLENAIAAYKEKEVGLIFNSGYQGNIGIISSLMGPGDLILCDKLCHASLLDGVRLSGATFYRYKHNDMAHLRHLLEKHHRSFKKLLIISESLFSMDGDKAPLAELVAVKNQFKAQLMIDEAHATGVFGKTGSGLVEEAGLADEIELIVGTFGKSLGTCGAYLACSAALKNELINRCRSFIYSTALPPSLVATTLASISLSKDCHKAREQVLSSAAYVAKTLRALGLNVVGDSQIISVIMGDNEGAVLLSKQLKEAGFWALPIRPPTVPKGTSRIRFSFTAHHTQDCCDDLMTFFKNSQDQV